MDGRRTIMWGGAVAALALASLGGAFVFNGGVVGAATGSSGGCNGEPATVPDQVPSNVHVVEAEGDKINPGPASINEADWIVEGQLLVRITDDAILVDPSGEAVLVPELRVELDAMKALNPTFAFHDRDSDIIVAAIDGSLPEEAERRLDVDVLPAIERIVWVEFDGGLDEIMGKLEGSKWVEWVEPVTKLQTASTDGSLAGYQWNVDIMRFDAVRDISDGSGAKVAIVDTGVTAYPDGFAHFDAASCIDLVDMDLTCDDPNGHGTHVASIVAQLPGEPAVQGMAPGATIIPVRVADADGISFVHQVANGIVYSADHGADVISVGVGGYLDSNTLRDAVIYAERKGAVVIAPVGNDGFRDMSMFPAAYRTVIGVGAADMSGAVTPYSNTGMGLDLYAPGGTVRIDDDGDGLADGVLAGGIVDGRPGFTVREGTSVAAAHVVGTAAVLASLDGDRLPHITREIIVGSQDGPATTDRTVRPIGMLNPLTALESVRDLHTGGKAAGEACLKHFECASWVCEGQGCGDDAPGTCAAETRTCTLDRKPYCGCDGETFLSSGTCPMERYAAGMPCADVAE